MALKLKLKVPSTGPPQSNGNQNQGSPSGLPKLKIKAPSQKENKVSKKHQQAGTKEKHKKLKLNIKQKNPEIDNIGIRGNAQPTRSVPKVRIKPTRVPGDGYDSEAPDLEDDPLIEQGIVVRFLNDANLDFVHNAVESGDLTGLNIKWVTKIKAVVNVNGTLYSAKLLDLPTITELYKTVDKKNIFKTFDICQILLVLHPVNPSDLNLERDFEVNSDLIHVHPLYKMSPKHELKPTKTVFKNGLIYPFEEVHRRFKPRKVNHRVVEDIEQRIDELIRLDDEAEESHFEIVDLTKQQTNQHRYSNISGTPSAVATPSVQTDLQAQFNNRDENEDDQEILAQSDEGDLEEELAKALENDETIVGNINMENEVDGEGIEEEGQEEDDEDDEDDEEDDDDDENDENDEDDESKADKEHVKMLEEEIADLENAVEVHRKGLASATHKMMKMKFQTSYNTLKASLDTKKRELAKVVSDQQQLQQKMDPNRESNTDTFESNQYIEDHDDQEDDNGTPDDNLDDIDDLF